MPRIPNEPDAYYSSSFHSKLLIIHFINIKWIGTRRAVRLLADQRQPGRHSMPWPQYACDGAIRLRPTPHSRVKECDEDDDDDEEKLSTSSQAWFWLC